MAKARKPKLSPVRVVLTINNFHRSEDCDGETNVWLTARIQRWERRGNNYVGTRGTEPLYGQCGALYTEVLKTKGPLTIEALKTFVASVEVMAKRHRATTRPLFT